MLKCQHFHYMDVKSNEQCQQVIPCPDIFIKQWLSSSPVLSICLVAVCHSFCIYFSLYGIIQYSRNIHTIIQPSFIKHTLRPISISS
jgi:hypothetical protein